MPAAQLGRPQPVIASSKVRGQVEDVPTIALPEPGLPPNATVPPGYPAYAPPGYAPPAYPYYPPPAYYPPPGYYAPPPAYYPPPPTFTPAVSHSSLPYAPAPDPVVRAALKGDPVRRTSFSSRMHTSRQVEDVNDTINDCCEWIKGCFTSDGRKFGESDHSLDIFASPVSNPFLFEDPRALTEIRPMFIWQTIPGSNPLYQGGNIYSFGLQARLALTDNISFVMHKLGGITIDPATSSGLEEQSGLEELWIGPKWTFVRNCQTNTAAAFGAIFQIPVGPASVAQDTGDFGIVPYFSIAQNFWRTSYGSMNFMNTFGISLAVGSDRSDFFYNSAHLDYDVANLHKIYPFVDLNWFHYTSSGNFRPVDFEGRDIANIGATNVSGRDYLTIATGLRYKFTENVQAGLGFEFPLTNPRDLQEFRLLVDLIFRY